MKIVLVEARGIPFHEFRENHIEKMKAIDSALEIVALSSNQVREINRELEDADVLAGTLWSIPEIHDVKKLKWIHSFSAGVERVLTAEVKASDVVVGNCAGIHAVPMGEHVLGFLLLFTRRFYDTFRAQQQKTWERSREMTELRGKIVLVVGLGSVGSEVARLVSCVGAEVIAVDQSTKEKPDFVKALHAPEQLWEVLGKADFVVSAIPHTGETHHLFDREKFRIMKQSAVLINISRGGVVHEQELIEALRQKIIAGAALDVVQEEPLPQESPLWEMENVLITPHHSGLSEKYMDRAVEVFCENLKAFLEGERLPNLVDKQKGY